MSIPSGDYSVQRGQLEQLPKDRTFLAHLKNFKDGRGHMKTGKVKRDKVKGQSLWTTVRTNGAIQV